MIIKKEKSIREKFAAICSGAGEGYWPERLITQFDYLIRVFAVRNETLPDDLSSTLDQLEQGICEEGCITRSAVLAAEERLKSLSCVAKSLSVIYAAHAHIDMNWEWGAKETVTAVIDTFQTMLDLMDEYPDFTFSQSQASTYEIIEKHCPSMLERIRARVQEGRWEVTASTWVEPDKNMTGTESMARHILYTKRYLSRLLGVSAESLNIDFEPDTFGHSANIPEILSQGGVKYYYHCRGLDGDRLIYRWRAPSGAEILCFHEPYWYASEVRATFITPIPDYCARNHVDTFLCVYGVGDHGGGPTCRDIERIRDMSLWPLMPNIRMGTFGEFFKEAEKHWDELEVVSDELNCVFTGCYTTQARLKRANRLGEERFYDAEVLHAMSGLYGDAYTHANGFENGWRKLLFNQFHDILPGSCVMDSCFHALGSSQEAMSICLANANRSMKWLTEKMDTSIFGGSGDPHSTAQGAGVGHNAMGSGQYNINAASRSSLFPFASRASGPVRAIAIFNTLPWKRNDVVEVILWDWIYPIRKTQLLTSEGQELSYDVLEENATYWSHKRTTLAVQVSVPAMGYACIFARYRPEMEPFPIANPKYGEDANTPPSLHPALELPIVTTPRVTRVSDRPIILENDVVRAEFESTTMKLKSLLDKRTDQRVITPDCPSCYFRLIQESDVYARSAWTVGNYALIQELNGSEFLYLEPRETQQVLHNVSYRIKFGMGSSMRVSVSLPKGSSALRFKLEIDWRETGKPGGATPQLQFFVPFAFEADAYRYDMPGGATVRSEVGHDVPATGWAAPLPVDGGRSFVVASDCKYGFRGYENSLTVNLLRAAYFPDPLPDMGMHEVNLCIAPLLNDGEKEPSQVAQVFAHPLIPCPCGIHNGSLPPEAEIFEIEGPTRVTSVRWEEDQAILRLCALGEGGRIRVSARQAIIHAWMSDIAQTVCTPIEVSNGRVWVEVPAHALRTLILEFEPQDPC